MRENSTDCSILELLIIECERNKKKSESTELEEKVR